MLIFVVNFRTEPRPIKTGFYKMNTLVSYNGEIFNVSPSDFFVTCSDRFLSGWGGATGKTHKHVIICPDYQTAQKIAYNLRKDKGMKYINICCRVPRYSSARFTVSVRPASACPLWNK